MRRAAKILGFTSVEFMGWDENFYDANDDRVLTLAKLVATHRPTVVVTHWPTGDYLVDSNKFAGIYVTRALGLSPTLVPEFDGIGPHYVKELFFFLMDQSIDTRGKVDPLGPIADFFVDITPVIGRKVQAFDQYVSQGYEGSMARKAAEARDGRFGMMANTSYAEAFMYSRSHDLPLAAAARGRPEPRIRAQRPAGRPDHRVADAVRDAARGLPPRLTSQRRAVPGR